MEPVALVFPDTPHLLKLLFLLPEMKVRLLANFLLLEGNTNVAWKFQCPGIWYGHWILSPPGDVKGQALETNA